MSISQKDSTENLEKSWMYFDPNFHEMSELYTRTSCKGCDFQKRI